MAWRICYAVVCPCGAARVDLGARDPEHLIEEAHRSGWEHGLCPECAREVCHVDADPVRRSCSVDQSG
jgi:hypothetical protein